MKSLDQEIYNKEEETTETFIINWDFDCVGNAEIIQDGKEKTKIVIPGDLMARFINQYIIDRGISSITLK